MPQTDTNYLIYPLLVQDELIEDTNTCLYKTPFGFFTYPNTEKILIERESIFTHNHLRVVSNEPIQRNIENSNTWAFISILAITLLIGWLFIINSNKLKTIFTSLFSLRNLYSLSNGSLNKRATKSFIFICYTFTLTLFLYWLIQYFEVDIPIPVSSASFIFTILLFIALSILILIKYALIRFLGNLFNLSEITKNYLFNIMNNNLIISLLFCPCLYVLFFAERIIQPFCAFFLMGLLSILIIIRLFMGFNIVLSESKFSKPYLFYYLCIIEFVPILVLAKFVVETLSAY